MVTIRVRVLSAEYDLAINRKAPCYILRSIEADLIKAMTEEGL